MIRLALIEDDEKIRSYLSALIQGTGEFSLVAAFGSTEEAMDFFSKGNPLEVELLMTDIELPGKNGIEFIEWFKPQFSSVQVMVLSSFDDSDRVFKALKAGASGYLLKNTSAVKLIESLQDLRIGGSPMSSQIARMVVSAFQQEPKANPMEVLSLREQDVLHWLAQGYRYQDIADKLFISVETVRTHIRNTYEKLHARNRKEALKKVGLS
jgi:DNA-binding NarL/FixJ family response regulator